MLKNILLGGFFEVTGGILILISILLFFSCFDNHEKDNKYWILSIVLFILGCINCTVSEYYNIKVDKEAYGSNAYSIRNRRR
jgi:hypothetical protein